MEVRRMRKAMIYFLTLVLLLVSVPAAFAQEASTQFVEQVNSTVVTQKTFTSEDVFSLERYVSVNAAGLFELDNKQAIADGVDKELLKGQQKYFLYLNTEIESGNLIANTDLTIKQTNQNKITSSTVSVMACIGITSDNEVFWWGTNKFFNSCDADAFAADLAGVAAVAGGMTLVTLYFPGVSAPAGITAAYFGLLSSRIAANNSADTGVEIAMTWAMAYNIEPQ
jgi:hypothetical protein